MKDWYDYILEASEPSEFTSSSYTAGTLESFLGDLPTCACNVYELFGLANPGNRVEVKTSADLKGFTRLASSNTLIRKSERDFWSLVEGSDGKFYIERLCDDDGNPLEG